MRIRLGPSLLLVALATAAPTGCDLLKPKVSKTKLESALADWLKNHDLVASEIHCPDNQKLEKGNTFQCTCEVHGIEVAVAVEVTDPATGTVAWKPAHLTMKGDQFADEIKSKPKFAGHDLTVTCADKVLVSIPDSDWVCQLVDHGDGDKKYDAHVKFKDSEGTHDISFEEKS